MTGQPTIAELWSQHGCSVIPVRLDKKPTWDLLPQVWNDAEKRTKGVWKPFQENLATAQEFEKWIAAQPPAFAIVTGKVLAA